jgi:hypothetical protein
MRSRRKHIGLADKRLLEFRENGNSGNFPRSYGWRFTENRTLREP